MGKPILHDVIHAHALHNMLGEFTCKSVMSKMGGKIQLKNLMCIFFDSAC